MRSKYLALAFCVSLLASLSACRNNDSTTTAKNNILYAANIYNNSITSYRETDNGNVMPLRTLSTATTSVAIAVSTDRNEILAAHPNDSVSVYKMKVDGEPELTKTITGDVTMLHGPNYIIVDNKDNEIVVTNSEIISSVVTSNTTTYYLITVYADDAYGNAAPIRTISGEATYLNAPTSIAVDSVHNEFYVTNFGSNAITVYHKADTGNVAPLRTIVGNNTGLSNPHGIAVDSYNDEIFVANFNANTITVYSRIADGNAHPVRTISGNVTGLNAPTSIALNLLADEIYVANLVGNSITVYSRKDNGNATPVRVISGGNTGLDGPLSLAIISQ